MIEIFKTEDGKLMEANGQKESIWISLTSPQEDEIQYVVNNFNIDIDFLLAALDKEEVSRLEDAEDQVLILTNASIEQENQRNQLTYRTIPVGLIITPTVIVSVSLEKLNCIEKIKNDKRIKLNLNKKTRFTLQVIYEITIQYLIDLRKIDKFTYSIETHIHKDMKDDHIIQLLALEKNLTYFLTALTSNEQVINRVFRYKSLPLYEDDNDLLDDVVIEIKQAQEMATINSKVIRSIRDASAAIMSNSLNNTMKILASFTIILTVPTMIYSFFGMNTYLAFFESNKSGTVIILVFSMLIAFWLYFIMKKKNMF